MIRKSRRALRYSCFDESALLSPTAFCISYFEGALVCVPKTLSVLMTPRNHLSWRNDRAPVFRRGGLGLTIQVEIRLEAENATLRHQLVVLRRKLKGRARLTSNDRRFFVQLYRWFPRRSFRLS